MIRIKTQKVLQIGEISFKWILSLTVFVFYFFKLGFTPHKAEQPLKGMELHKKEAQKD